MITQNNLCWGVLGQLECTYTASVGNQTTSGNVTPDNGPLRCEGMCQVFKLFFFCIILFYIDR